MKKNDAPALIKTVNEEEFVQTWLNLKALHSVISLALEIERAIVIYRNQASNCPEITQIKVRINHGAAKILKYAA